MAICTPPQVRHRIAREALAAGKHVLLEKPPAATLSELEDLKDAADEGERVALHDLALAIQPRRRGGTAGSAGETVKRLW